MKKILAAGVVMGLAGLGALMVLNYGVPATLSAESLGQFRKEMLLHSDSLSNLDFMINDLMREDSLSKNGQARLDSLKNTQAKMWPKYAELRTQIAGEKDNQFHSALLYIQGIFKEYWRMGALGVAGLFILFGVGLVFHRKSRASLVKQPSLPRRRLERQGFKEIRTSRYARKSSDAKLKKVIRGLAEITESQLKNPSTTVPHPQKPLADGPSQKPSEEPGPADSGKTKKPEIQPVAETAVAVTHLDDESSVIMDIRPESVSNTSVAFQENGSGENQGAAEEVPFFNQAEINPPDRKSRWARYESEQNKKVNILKLARKGSTPSEISRRLRVSQDEVELILRANQD